MFFKILNKDKNKTNTFLKTCTWDCCLKVVLTEFSIPVLIYPSVSYSEYVSSFKQKS